MKTELTIELLGTRVSGYKGKQRKTNCKPALIMGDVKAEAANELPLHYLYAANKEVKG